MPRYQKPPEVPQDDDYTKILEKYHEIKRQIAHAEALITDEPAEIIDICSPEKDEESDGSNEGDTLMNLRFQALASGSKKWNKAPFLIRFKIQNSLELLF